MTMGVNLMKQKKKSTILNGILIHPLLVGCRAFIFYCGRIIRTSPIVAIHDENADEVCFETANTNYTLLKNPTPHSAANSYWTGLAA